MPASIPSYSLGSVLLRVRFGADTFASRPPPGGRKGTPLRHDRVNGRSASNEAQLPALRRLS